MIVFYGQITGKCKEDVLRRDSKFGYLGGIITSIIFGIPAIILTFTVHWIFVICIPLLFVVAFTAGMPPSKKYYSLLFPSEIIIDTKTSTIISQSEKFRVESSMDEVVKVLDMGEWYHIYVKSKEGRFICQKDLIIKGTLDEFESIFRNKIIKKL